MTSKSFGLIAGVIFLVMAVAHVLRLIFHFDVIFAGYIVPMWVNWVAAPLAAYLAWSGFGISRKASP